VSGGRGWRGRTSTHGGTATTVMVMIGLDVRA
jgi:hypothetical protein